MKNLISILCVIGIFAVVGLVVWNNMNASSANIDSDYSFDINDKCENLPETFVDNQSKARDISSKFINYLIKNRTVFADATTYSVDGICAVDFPDYFAGKYINTDGKLIMQVTQDYYSADYRISDWYQELIGIVQSEDFACHPVKYSYHSLVDGMTSILWGDISKRLADESIQITAAYINDYENCLYVCIGSNIDYNKVSAILDSDMFKIEVGDLVLSKDTSITLKPGRAISLNSSGEYPFSMACRARRYNTLTGQYEYGFLTCGHAFSGTTANVYTNQGTYIGFSYAAVQKNAGTVDAAFVTTADGVDVSTQVQSENVTLYNTYSINMGDYIFKRGIATQTTGGIASSGSYSYYWGGVYFTDFVQTSYYSKGGDSGGIVYSEPNSSNYAYPLGIHSGHVENGGNECVYSFFCKLSNALSGLQIPYIYVYLY